MGTGLVCGLPAIRWEGMDAEAKLELEHAIGVQENLHKEHMEKKSKTALANRRVRAELKRKRKACVAAP